MRLETHMSYPAPSHDAVRRSARWDATSRPPARRNAIPSILAWLLTVRSFVAAAWRRHRKEARVRSTIMTLESFDDRTLCDIGIHRCLIVHAVRTGLDPD